MKNIETWKDIPNFEGLYQASTFGRVRSVTRVINTSNSYRKNAHFTLYGKILRDYPINSGYRIVHLRKDGRRIAATVHRLIASTFIPNTGNFETVNHKDGNKSNNSANNLEWASKSDNCKHAYKIGLTREHNTKRRSVICLSTGKTYTSLRAAQRDTGILSSAISLAARGITKKAGGLKWKYKQTT